MNIKNLKAFVAVIRHKGFTPAAASLYLTQSAISKAVKSLEEELNVTLLNRKSPEIALTFAGEIVYKRALALSLELDGLFHEINEFKGMIRGVLRLGLPPLASGLLFASIFTTFRSMYPDIEIELIEQGGGALMELLNKGEIEIAVTLRPESSEYGFLGVINDPLRLVLDKENVLVSSDNIDLSHLKGQPFILFEKGFSLNKMITDACEKRGFYPKVSVRSAQIDFIVDLVSAKFGIALLPDILARQHGHKDIFIKELNEADLVWDIGLAWKKEVELSPAARAWIDLVKINRHVV
ncbi:LysR family transcriptional regulator [Ewingella americana]|uniref:LysR family transcriptional regulator n=1 Tax=Ewingella americana TaxID=41202 RepID=UPI0016399060|nr:LysR family transcriptional regulator [Ewingella americana]QMV54227.1 LysR family transcriptional regulator [Ewingella americana]